MMIDTGDSVVDIGDGIITRDEVVDGVRIIEFNQTSTPPITSEEYKLGVQAALSQLRKFHIPHQDIQRGITWANTCPQTFADEIQNKLLPELKQ